MAQNLLLIPLGADLWAVREEDVASISPVKPLHRLPLSPPQVAGMTILDGGTVTVFDLNACVGAPPLAQERYGRLLTVRSPDPSIAFVVAGPVDPQAYEPEQVRSLPDAARTDVVRECVVLGPRILPLVDIGTLRARIGRGILDAPKPERRAATELPKRAGTASVSVLTLGGQRFCIDGGEVRYRPLEPGAVSALPYAGDRIEGVVEQDGAVVPVIPVGRLIGAADLPERQMLLTLSVNGTRCGFRVDGEAGVREGVRLLDLPPLARPAWSSRAIMDEGMAVPLIDMARILSGTPETADGEWTASSTPASRFPDLFLRESVMVLELAVFGDRHALPREEVRAILPLRAVRPLSGVPEIVLGIAEFDGTLLPVLDLDAVFGRRMPYPPDGKLVHLVNGEFSALIATASVTGERGLAMELQRQVPIALPHRVLYGCYLDGNTVRLILNVQSLSEHFEKAEVREIITSLASPRPAVAAEPASAAADVRPERSPGPPVTAVVGPDVRPEDIRRQRQPAADLGEMPAAALARSGEAGPDQEELQRPADKARDEETQAARLREESARARAAEEQRRAEVTAKRAAEQERLRAEAERRRLEEDEARTRAEQEARAQAEREERNRFEEAQRNAEELRRRKEAEAAVRRAVEQARDEAETRERERELALRQEEREARAAARQAERIVVDELPAPVRDSGEVPAQKDGVKKRRMLVMAGALAVLVAIVVFFMVGGRRTSVTPPVRTETVPQKAPRTAGAPAREEAPLVLMVPKSMPEPETVVYVVVKGDTLWGISKRFTGNPFNYPRVARDNSIATPDLIFPGQKIRLQRE